MRFRGSAWLRTLTHPLIAFPLWVVNLYVWHIPALYEAAQGASALHALEHACFIGFGVLMWMPLVGPLPQAGMVRDPGEARLRGRGSVRRHRPRQRLHVVERRSLLATTPSGEATGTSPPLTDQGIAGVIMIGEGGLVTLGVLVWLFLSWAQQDTERQRLLDLAESEGVPLSEARAGRAAAAGQGARLEERIGGLGRVSGNRFLYLLVFVVGTASLGAEIAAARLMAPFFGASTIVWANTIGVVLVALSIGYWLGGGWAIATRTCAGSAWWSSRRRPCWRWCRSPRARSSRSPPTRSTRSRPAPSSARWSACSS